MASSPGAAVPMQQGMYRSQGMGHVGPPISSPPPAAVAASPSSLYPVATPLQHAGAFPRMDDSLPGNYGSPVPTLAYQAPSSRPAGGSPSTPSSSQRAAATGPSATSPPTTTTTAAAAAPRGLKVVVTIAKSEIQGFATMFELSYADVERIAHQEKGDRDRMLRACQALHEIRGGGGGRSGAPAAAAAGASGSRGCDVASSSSCRESASTSSSAAARGWDALDVRAVQDIVGMDYTTDEIERALTEHRGNRAKVINALLDRGPSPQKVASPAPTDKIGKSPIAASSSPPLATAVVTPTVPRHTYEETFRQLGVRFPHAGADAIREALDVSDGDVTAATEYLAQTVGFAPPTTSVAAATADDDDRERNVKRVSTSMASVTTTLRSSLMDDDTAAVSPAGVVLSFDSALAAAGGGGGTAAASASGAASTADRRRRYALDVDDMDTAVAPTRSDLLPQPGF